MRLSFVFLAISCLIVVTGCSERPAQDTHNPVRAAGVEVFSVLPQDKALYVVWQPVLDAVTYSVYYRQKGASDWLKEQTASNSVLIRNLVNGQQYELVVMTHNSARQEFASATILSIPQNKVQSYPRFSSWVPNLSLFTNASSASAWMKQTMMDPQLFYCRGNQVHKWDNLNPDCIYHNADWSERLVLLRAAGNEFCPIASPKTPTEIRKAARSILWPLGDPFQNPSRFNVAVENQPNSDTGLVSGFAEHRYFEITYGPALKSRVHWFIPPMPTGGHYALYLEGHGGRGIDVGAETINWLLARGWQVLGIDMPLVGENAKDSGGFPYLHNDLAKLDSGGDSPVGLFAQPIKAVVDLLSAKQDDNRTLMIIGRSGGGWSSYFYSALDERIDIAVSIAGGVPLSRTLDNSRRIDGSAVGDFGDYEQHAPELYDLVGHEDLMTAAGSRLSLFVYNTNDPCCFNLTENDPFVAFLRERGKALNKNINVFVDPDFSEHGMSFLAYTKLDTLLEGYQN